MLFVFTLPESPQYLLQKANRLQAAMAEQGKNRERLQSQVAKCIESAYKSLTRLNKTDLQATRELMLIYHSLKHESEGRDHSWYKSSILELFKEKRSRHALYGSLTVMFIQQLCGVNVLVYYSTSVAQSTLPGGSGSIVSLTDWHPYLVGERERHPIHSTHAC